MLISCHRGNRIPQSDYKGHHEAGRVGEPLKPPPNPRTENETDLRGSSLMNF